MNRTRAQFQYPCSISAALPHRTSNRWMQLGGREGGFALAVGGLSMPYAYGVYMGLIMRLRELVWIILGIGLMKFGNKNSLKSKRI